MPSTQLRETVKRLRLELETGAALGPEQIQVLSEALSEIETLLASDASASTESASIMAKLREAEAHFGQSHPNLTYAVGAVADALSKLGI